MSAVVRVNPPSGPCDAGMMSEKLPACVRFNPKTLFAVDTPAFDEK